ncbi:MAG TPA: F0F1 ATP synthase subunit B [Acidimicrobiales bacterium]|nr:F0F1 ATP synthase subunit B [Acidimicrobiales bacterium]
MRVRSIFLALVLGVAGVLATTGTAWAQDTTTSDKTEISKESEECIELLEEGKDVDACHEAPSVILPATNELIWGAISFFLLLALMWKFALPAVKDGMEARTEKIRGDLDEAERIKAEAQQILADYQRQLADAKDESSRIIDEARQTAEQMRRDLMVRAEAEVNELRDRTRTEIDAAQQRAIADLRNQVSELAIGAAEVVVQKNLDRDTNRALVERYIEQVGTNA